MNKKKVVIGIIGALAFIAIGIAVLRAVSPSVRRTLFGFRHKASPAYSKGDYDGIDISEHQRVIKWARLLKTGK